MRALLTMMLDSLFLAVVYVAFPTTAVAASCPEVSAFTSNDTKTYLARFYDAEPFTGSVDAKFYTAGASYITTVANLSISNPSKAGGFLSKSFAFANPSTEAIEGVTLTYRGSDAETVCAQSAPVPVTVDDVKLAEYFAAPAPDPYDSPLRLSFATSESPLPCKQPYALTRIVKTENPDYPESAKMIGASGTAFVLVFVSADGSVTRTSLGASSGNASLDSAARSSASKSTYSPASFRCTPMAGTFVYKAEFSMSVREF